MNCAAWSSPGAGKRCRFARGARSEEVRNGLSAGGKWISNFEYRGARARDSDAFGSITLAMKSPAEPMVRGLSWPLEGDGFEPPVPRQRRHPSATANHLSEPRRPVFN